MERRNRSLEALNNLIYIDSLELSEKGDSLVRWVNKYLSNSSINEFDLDMVNLERLSELLHKNINFLNNYSKVIKKELDSQQKIVKFLK